MVEKTSASIVLGLGDGSPILRYCGEYSNDETYVFNQDFRDYVRQKNDDGDWEYFAVAKRWNTVKGVPPIGDTSGKWQKSVELGFLKAGAITADMIDVDSLIVKHLVTQSANKKVVVDNGTLQLIVNEVLRVLISGDNMGENDPAPSELSIIANNKQIASSSVAGTKNIDVTIPILNVPITKLNSNVYVPPINVTFTRSGLPIMDFVMYMGWNNQGLRDTFRQVTSTNLSYQMPPLMLTTTMDVGQTQVLKLHISGTYQATSIQATSLSVSTTSVRKAIVTIPTQKVELASDGFRASYSDNREFLLKYENGSLLLRHRGDVDISGALAWGTVYSYGRFQNSGGYYLASVSKIGVGVYEITHEIPHSNYTIIAPNCTIVSRSSNTCTISTGAEDKDFDFVIFGNNDN